MPTPFWKHPAHRIPTLGLYRALLKSTFSLPHNCVHQPGPRRIPIQHKGVGPPGSSDPLPRLQRSYLFQLIRDQFRSNRYCTSPRITAGYLREAEETLKKLRRARDGDQEVKMELKDLAHGRSGRLKEVIDHVSLSSIERRLSTRILERTVSLVIAKLTPTCSSTTWPNVAERPYQLGPQVNNPARSVQTIETRSRTSLGCPHSNVH